MKQKIESVSWRTSKKTTLRESNNMKKHSKSMKIVF